jgi:double-stranded uracil-DNA glycosylase
MLKSRAKSLSPPARSNIRHKGPAAETVPAVEWASLRLRDRIAPGVRVLFVGINPGVRSATVGHHFAGPSNRFWKLLFESGLVSERIGYLDDDRLGEWGYGITNLVPRATPGIGDLRPVEYAAGWRALDRKIRKHKPAVVALVGVTLYRAILPLVVSPASAAGRMAPRMRLGAQGVTIHGARVFVLPNPSGRNANFSYREMLAAFRMLARYLSAASSAPRSDAVMETDGR